MNAASCCGFGGYARTAEPGLHFALWPVETMEKVRFASQRQTEIGGGDEGLMLAGDQNIVSVKFTVFWRVRDAEEYLFNVQEPGIGHRAPSRRARCAKSSAAPLPRSSAPAGRKAAEDQVFTITQETLDSYKAGVLITGIRLNEADPPAEVRDAFAEVQRAEQDQAKLINEADQYANQKNPARRRRSSENRRRCKGLQIASRVGSTRRSAALHQCL